MQYRPVMLSNKRRFETTKPLRVQHLALVYQDAIFNISRESQNVSYNE